MMSLNQQAHGHSMTTLSNQQQQQHKYMTTSSSSEQIFPPNRPPQNYSLKLSGSQSMGIANQQYRPHSIANQQMPGTSAENSQLYPQNVWNQQNSHVLPGQIIDNQQSNQITSFNQQFLPRNTSSQQFGPPLSSHSIENQQFRPQNEENQYSTPFSTQNAENKQPNVMFSTANQQYAPRPGAPSQNTEKPYPPYSQNVPPVVANQSAVVSPSPLGFHNTPNLATQQHGSRMPPNSQEIRSPMYSPNTEQVKAENVTPASSLHGKRYPQAQMPAAPALVAESRLPGPNQAYQHSYGSGYEPLSHAMQTMNLGAPTGFNRLYGAENIDLLQCPNVLPQEKVDSPKVSLGQECLDAANCSPE